MRQPATRIILLFAIVASIGVASRRADADDRADARTHYQNGLKLFNTSDYRGAIKEFNAAQQLVPSDLMHYNLGLCYDKLGEAEPAIEHYRAYLDKIPDAPKRTEIEASITRLEGAAKSAAAKRAEEARKADEAKKAEDARRAEEAKRAEPPAPPPPPANVNTPPANVGQVGGNGGGATVGGGVGSTGTPGTGQVVPPTGDAQLDRINQIDINAIRDQRVNGGASGMVDPRTANGRGAVATAGGPNGQPPPYQAPNAVGAQPQPLPGQPPPEKKEAPLYKKWWFWVVIAVSVVVVYEIVATSSSQPMPVARGALTSPTTHALPPQHNVSGGSGGGITLWHF
jgi:hypothetical protein